MPLRRFRMMALLGMLVGCQQILGLDEGTVRGAGGASSSATGSSGASSATGVGGATSSSTTTTASTTSSSATGMGGASSSAASSSAASSGAGGGPVLDLIDDMEAGTGQILKVHGRAGTWFAYNDTTGVQTPSPTGSCLPEAFAGGGGAPNSTRAMHTTGTQFSSWGAGLGFDLNHPGAAARQPYDASQYKGIVFWAKGQHAAPIPDLKVRMLEPAIVPVGGSGGGTCAQPDGGLPCGDNHTASVTITSTWQSYEVPFTAFHQVGWGLKPTPPELAPAVLLAVQFAVENTADFDYWIDDVSFYQ